MKKPEIVVVTGATAGVGRATVREFAKRGAHIGLMARGAEGLHGAKREVEAAGGKALILPLDVANPDQVEAAASAVEDKLGPIDVWVNNAMTSVFAPIKQTTRNISGTKSSRRVSTLKGHWKSPPRLRRWRKGKNPWSPNGTAKQSEVF